MADSQSFKCPDCGKEFSKEESMQQHRKDAHQKTEQVSEKNTSRPSFNKPFRIGKFLPYIIGVIIILGVIYIIYWSLSSTNNIGQIGSFNLTSSFVPYEGNTSAKINVVEFGDYQCPICAGFAVQTEPQITQNYVNTGKLKFYFFDFAFLGPDSQTLSQGAWCANDQGLYYQYHNYVYVHQGTENSGWGSASNVKLMAANIPGMNSTQFSSCLDSGKYQSVVQQNTRLGQNSGVSGTPTFFIGNDQIGYLAIVGAQSYSVFQQDIDSQLTRV